MLANEARSEQEKVWINLNQVSGFPIIGVSSEVKDSNMQRNDYHNIIHSFILGIGFIGYEIGL
jgi:hypothetical protein